MSAHDYDGLETEFKCISIIFLDIVLLKICMSFGAIYIFLGGSDGKESTCNVGDPGLILGLGRFPGEDTPSNTLAWRIPWTEEPGGLQSMGLQRA